MENYQLSIKRYSAYKDSGIEWLEEIPEHWLSVRIKDVIKHIDQGWSPNAENRIIEEGEWGVLKLSAISNGKYYEMSHKALPDTNELKHQYLVKKGDLLITRSNTPELVGDCCLVLVEPTFNLMYSDLVYCLRIQSRKISDRYLNYLLCCASFRWLKTVSARGLNTSMVKISQGIICRWNIFSPPSFEQKAIAHYLDTKTTQIDRKIDLLTQKATLYSNLKQSLINETVIRGLDKTVPMKDSGIEWLGEVPEHWGIYRAKDTAKRIGNGVTPRGGSEVYTGLGIPLLRSQNVYDDGLRIENVSFIPTKIHNEMRNSQLKASDILINITGASIGRTCMLPVDLGAANINQHIAFLRIKRWFNASYISLFLKSYFIKVYIQIEQNGASKEAFNLNQIANIPLVLPPLEEQKAIADYLDIKTAQIDQIIQTINTQIEKLKELRKTLINDVVTGKIKVIDNGEWIMGD